MNNKAFTLVELLAVIVILSVVLTITFLAVNSILDNSKENLSEKQKNNIESAAQVYYLKEGMSKSVTCVTVSDLINKGYIEAKEVKDPETREVMTGSVNIIYESNQYNYEYQEKTCE